MLWTSGGKLVADIFGSTHYRRNTGEGKGSSISTFRMLKPVLLLPRVWRGDIGALGRGFDGRPTPTRALRGGDGTDLSSGGVGGNWLLATSLLTGVSLFATFELGMTPVCWSSPIFPGIDVGAGAGLLARGPLFSSNKLTNLLTPAPGTAFRLNEPCSNDLSSLWEWQESFRSSSLFEGWCPRAAA